jgi:hypothetical protein
MEPLFYEFRKLTAGAEVGFSTGTESVTELIPSKDYVYYITGWGMNGKLKVQIKYPSGYPRNTTTAKTTTRLDNLQAHYLQPFTSKMALVTGDSIEVDLVADHAYTYGAIWFYGWKFYVEQTQPTSTQQIIYLEDVRQL